MAENKNFDEKTPSDVLHNHAVELSNWSPHQRSDEQEGALNEIAEHPNTSTETLTHLHNANFDQNTGKVKDEHHASTLMSHKNFPASLAEQFATKAQHDSDYDSLVGDASNVKGVSHDLFENIAQNKINSGHDIPDFHSLRPEFYLKQLKDHAPGTATDEETQDRHGAVRQFAMTGLAHTPHHTQETLDATVKHFTDNDYEPSDMEDFVQQRKDLSSKHLDQLYSKYGEAGAKRWGDDISDRIAEHPNTDPALLAKLAIGTKKTGHNEKAMANPALPAETRKALIKKHAATKDSNIADGLSENPATTPEELAQLHKQSDSSWQKDRLIRNEKFPAEKLAEHWESSDKKTDAARGMLHAPNLPTSVLKDLVMHSNQDVAAEALKHKNVDQSVLDVALKRRAPKINNLAKLHPLVIDQELQKGIMENKIPASKIFGHSEFKAGFNRLSPENQEKALKHLSERYVSVDNFKDAKEKLNEEPKDFIAAKAKLATSNSIPLAERNKHATAIVQQFKDAFPHNSKIEHWRMRDEDNKGNLKFALENMAAQGNTVAQKAILNHPAALESFDIKRRQDAMVSGQFAGEMLDKMLQYNAQGTTLMDERGDQSKFLNTSRLKDLAKHPDISPDHIAKLANVPEYWSEQHPLENKDGDTILDQHFGKLPEDQKHEYFAKFVNKADPNIDANIALSVEAPRDIWDTAWHRLDNDNKNRLAAEYGMGARLPEDEISNALDGRYNSEADPESDNYVTKTLRNSLQQKVLKHLEDNNHDAAALNRFLTQQASMDKDAPQKMDSSDIARNIPEHFVQGQAGEKALQDTAADRDTMSRIAIKKLYVDKMVPDSWGDKDQAKQKANDALDAIKRWSEYGTESQPPEVASNMKVDFWNHLLAEQKEDRYTSEGQALKNLLPHLKNGELNFLADLPGAEADDLKKRAVQLNLLTKDKVDSVMNAGLPFRDVYSNMSTSKRKEFVHNLLANPGLFKPEHVSPILNHLDSSFFNPDITAHNSDKAMKPEHLDGYVDNLQKMSQLILQHSPQPERDMKDLFASAFENVEKTRRSTRTRSGAPNTETLKKVAAKMVDHADESQFADPLIKNKMKLAIYEALPEKLRSKTLLGSIIKSAAAEKNVSVILSLTQKNAQSPVLQKAISDILSKPENLTFGQAVDATSLIRQNSTTTENSKRLVASLESKMSTMDPQSLDVQVAKTTMLNSLNESLHHMQEGKDKFIVDTIKKYTTDENLHVRQEANSKVRKLISKQNIMSFDERLSTYLSLSSNPADFKPDVSIGVDDTDILNNAKTMEHSTEGWKLSNLADNADQLNFGNAAILANRLMALKDTTQGQKLIGDAVYGMMHNESASEEDMTKLIRTMDRTQLDAAIVRLRDSSDGLLDSNAHVLLKEAANRLDRTLADESGIISSESINNLAYDMHNISSIIKRSPFDEDASYTKEKLESQSEAIEKLNKAAAKIVEHYSKPENHNSLKDVLHSANVGYLGSIANNILSSGRSFGKEDAMHIADLMSYPAKLAQITGNENVKDAKTFAANISKWAAQAEGLKHEDWKAAFEANPSMSFAIGHRPVIDTHVLDAVDINKMMSHDANFTRSEMSKWFSKMDDEALSKHGKQLLSTIMANKSSVNADTLKKTFPYMRDKLSLKDIEGFVHDPDTRLPMLQAAVAHNAGGPDTLNAYLKSVEKEGVMMPEDLAHAAKSMHIDDKASQKIWKHISSYQPEAASDMVSHILQNKFAPLDLVRNGVSWAQDPKVSKELGESASRELLSMAMENPSIPLDMYNKLFDATKDKYQKYFSAGSSFHPALANSKHGGRLFRSLPVVVPKEVPSVDANKMAKVASANPPEKLVKKSKQIQEAMAMVPPEGINWVEFKRRAPAMENIPEIKKMFMDKKNTPVVPEDFVKLQQTLDASMKAKSFHLTYSQWKGMQTHNGGTNLVVQVNNSEESEQQLAQDPKLWAFYQMLLRQGNNISLSSNEGRIGGHPTTPQLVSWGRVDTKSGKDGWIVEELQSDFSQRFRRNARALLKNTPSGIQVDGHIISPEEIKRYLPQIDKAIEGHHAAALNSIIESAKAHGVKKLYVHGSGVRGNLSGRAMPKPDASPAERATAPSFLWFYDELPQSAGFQKVDYADYPNYDKDLASELDRKGTSSHCWALDLSKKKA